jgi:hypothetical protein
MTEAKWLACSHPRRMLDFLRRKASERKLRLFACACCRRIWTALTDERSRKAVEVAERFADGDADESERYEAEMAASEAVDDAVNTNFHAANAAFNAVGEFTGPEWESAHQTCADAAGAAEEKHNGKGRRKAYTGELAAQTELLRDVIGNPFRVVAVDPGWLGWNGVVPKLAQGIYVERAFDRLLILADALEEAGCTNADILGHCRGPGPHVRGCWVIDLILGKG